ncbi:hypothetical protein [Streptomyces gibsoniae]|uniref:Uncharacterized protein n=1 Tax=Streptomyces gibsoniae TaxID=3075529 RepID=A0ABU2U6E1_9ACTN|nr:hypothetical protein [Streptomyces sp. DSM 41699]MDT0468801.1 hypothetical protein [Streptomyces sp. DSM 41699]
MQFLFDKGELAGFRTDPQAQRRLGVVVEEEGLYIAALQRRHGGRKAFRERSVAGPLGEEGVQQCPVVRGHAPCEEAFEPLLHQCPPGLGLAGALHGGDLSAQGGREPVD